VCYVITFFLRESNTTLTLHEISYRIPYKNFYSNVSFVQFGSAKAILKVRA